MLVASRLRDLVSSILSAVSCLSVNFMNKCSLKFRLTLALISAAVLNLAPAYTASVLPDPSGDFAFGSKEEPIVDEFGHQLFSIYLDEELAEMEGDSAEEPMRLASDPRNAKDWRGWHRGTVRAMVKRLERDYGIEAVSMTSHLLPTFSAHLAVETKNRLEEDGRVIKIAPVFRGMDQFSAWSDLPGGGDEIIPWGKIAIGTNDNRTTANTVYMIDGDEQPHVDLVNMEVAPVNSWFIDGPEHANHVAGILSAKSNNGHAVRGINPSSKVISVHRGADDPQIKSALDWVFIDSEQKGIFPVVNFSSNSMHTEVAGTYGSGGTYGVFVKCLSARALFVQSAGNYRENACLRAWNTPEMNDGILVVGGIDESGAQTVLFDNAGSGYQSEPGSNFGPCVEVWAPSQRIWSTWSTSTIARQRLSGTSMAAPHVSAFAARYGNNMTTPVQREHYVRSKLVLTGHLDDLGYAIRIPSMSGSGPSVPNLLSPLSVRASSTLAGSSVNYLIDRKYGDPARVWNAGGPAPAWVEFDLRAPRSIRTVRLTPEQSPTTGTLTHRIYVGDDPNVTTPVATASGSFSSREPIVLNMNATGRYVRILTAVSSSWVAWREIEIYGF